MKGYLMQEQSFVRGSDTFIESYSPENRWGVVFEDDGDTAYFYAMEKDPEGQGLRVLDALHIYETADKEGKKGVAKKDLAKPVKMAKGTVKKVATKTAKPAKAAAQVLAPTPPSKLIIVWSRDWEKCALVIDGFCHAIYDFKEQGGYSINEFPPPNSFWTKGDRKLTDQLINSIF
jgi:hypothetical protein